MNNSIISTNKRIIPEDYQNEAIIKVRNNFLSHIESQTQTEDPYEVLLESTVASGKTVMGGLIMESLVEALQKEKDKYHKEEVAFVWVSTSGGGLLTQSKNSVDSFANDSLNVMDLQTAIKKQRLISGDALFMGWESINSDVNIVRRDNETGNLQELFENTKVKVILVIDESHRDREGAKNIKVISDIIKPYAVLNLTATPSISNQNSDVVRVDPQRVIDAGRIRKKIRMNVGIDDFLDNDGSYQSKILDSAIAKQKEIKQYTQDNDIMPYIRQTPLILIQIANDNANNESSELDKIKTMLLDKGISESNIAINLSGEKFMFDDIDDNGVDFLIMKQAVSTGWDCPRAQILVQFRETKSITFHLQTLGRIMRTLKGQHYNNDLLDDAYLYTDADDKEYSFDVNIDGSLPSVSHLTHKVAYLRDEFKDNIGKFEIPMEKVVFEKLGDVDSEFLWNSLNEEIDLDILDATNLMDLNKSISVGQDIDTGTILKGEAFSRDNTKQLDHKLSTSEVKDIFIRNIDANLNIYTIRKMIMYILKEHKSKTDYTNVDDFVYRLYCNNKIELDRAVFQAVGKFKTMQMDKQSESVVYKIQDEIYRVGFNDSTSDNYAYDREDNPDARSSSEGPFMMFLKFVDDVEYWFKNQVSTQDFSIVYYDKNKRPHEYSPDFFIIDKLGRLFIVDTKSRHGDKEHEFTKEKYESGKQFERMLNKNQGQFTDIIFSMIRLDKDENPTILIGDDYRGDFTSEWIDFRKVLKGEIKAR